LRTEQGWTQIDVAEHAGLGRFSSRIWSAAKKEPCLRPIEILAIAFELTVPQLFRIVLSLSQFSGQPVAQPSRWFPSGP
jgi:transcriptional regulator with XRE-family HTH domain